VHACDPAASHGTCDRPRKRKFENSVTRDRAALERMKTDHAMKCDAARRE